MFLLLLLPNLSQQLNKPLIYLGIVYEKNTIIILGHNMRVKIDIYPVPLPHIAPTQNIFSLSKIIHKKFPNHHLWRGPGLPISYPRKRWIYVSKDFFKEKQFWNFKRSRAPQNQIFESILMDLDCGGRVISFWMQMSRV